MNDTDDRSPDPEEIRQALGRVSTGAAFRNAPQLVGFLTFVVEKTLAGQAHGIKGYTIATQALGRPDEFDPQTDPIVRVEAGRLRRALDSYYGGQGRFDAVRIVIPRGTYVPRFEPQEEAKEDANGEAAPASEPQSALPVSALPVSASPVGSSPDRGLDAPAEEVREARPAQTPARTLARTSAIPTARIDPRRRMAAAFVVAAAVAAIVLALHWNETGWIARTVRAPLGPPQRPDADPVVLIGPRETGGVGTGAATGSLRRLMREGLARTKGPRRPIPKA